MRSELIMFMTPHIIYDETGLIEASDELKARVKMLKKRSVISDSACFVNPGQPVAFSIQALKLLRSLVLLDCD